MHSMKKQLLIILLCTITYCAQASITIKGIVKDESGETLPAVSIIIKGTSTGTSTDIDGKYSIQVPNQETVLVFSFVGYKNQEITVGKQTSINITLRPNEDSLNEIVVTSAKREKSRKGKSKKAFLSKPKASPERIYDKVDAVGYAEETEASYGEDAELFDELGSADFTDDPSAKSGLLTAGELHDFSKWELWKDIAENDLKEWQNHWEINPLGRYTIQLVSKAGFPLVDAPVELQDKSGKTIWRARTDNTGKAELWSNIFSDEAMHESKITADVNGTMHTVSKPTRFQQGVNILTIDAPCNMSTAIDIAFVVDATGSMGDEIRYLQAELEDVVKRVKDSLPASQLNLGSVFYRDSTDDYITRYANFSEDPQPTLSFIKEQYADGGGNYPEAMDAAVEVALDSLDWSESAKARLLFLVLDAPPHHNDDVKMRLRKLMRQAAQKGIRIIPVTGSGLDKSTEYLMRCMALATNGTYVFLTDDSGIGGSHIKPTTDEFKVELLNDLLLRLIFAYTNLETCEQITLKEGNGTVNSDTTKTKLPKDPEQFDWKFYPNPTNGIFTIDLSEDIQEVFITDLTGKIIQRLEPKTKRFQADLSAYPNGVYFVRFSYKGKTITGKVLVRR